MAQLARQRGLSVELLHSQIPDQISNALELNFALSRLDVVHGHRRLPRVDNHDLLSPSRQHC